MNIIRDIPFVYHKQSPHELVFGQVLNISHFKKIGSVVYILISSPQKIKMESQRRLGVYVGFDSSYFISYLEPLTGDIFTARYVDCHFDESVFPSLRRIMFCTS